MNIIKKLLQIDAVCWYPEASVSTTGVVREGEVGLGCSELSHTRGFPITVISEVKSVAKAREGKSAAGDLHARQGSGEGKPWQGFRG